MDRFVLYDFERKRSNSVCTEEELLKRKREPEPHLTTEVFQKSKKTSRTPVKVKRQNSDAVDVRILKLLEELTSDIKDIKKSNAELKEEFTHCQENWKKERDELRDEIKTLSKKVEALEQNEEIRKKAEKKRNIVITGINFKSNSSVELDKEIRQFLKTELDVNAEVSNSHKISNNSMYVTKCSSMSEKLSLMKNKHKLYNKKAFINDDYTKNELVIQKKLREIAAEERKQGKKVRVGYKKIQVDGEWKTWNEIKTFKN